QQLVWITTMSLVWRPRPKDAKAIALPRTDARHIPVPAMGIHFRQAHTRLIPRIVEQHELDAFRDLGEHGEVRPRAVESRAERIRLSRPDRHGWIPDASAPPEATKCRRTQRRTTCDAAPLKKLLTTKERRQRQTAHRLQTRRRPEHFWNGIDSN